VLTYIPPLEKALEEAGFAPKTESSVGVWVSRRVTSQQVAIDVGVDLLVPASVSPGRGRRAARLPGHETRAARLVRGLDGALVDADLMTLGELDAGTRAFDVRVAGPSALLVAKLHKISEREGTGRQSDKDALDVLRLLRGTETDELAGRYERLLADDRSEEAASTGRQLLETQFARGSGIGIAMAIRSAGVLADADEIAASCEALASDLLAALR
jgi:hypothetical protein